MDKLYGLIGRYSNLCRDTGSMIANTGLPQIFFNDLTAKLQQDAPGQSLENGIQAKSYKGGTPFELEYQAVSSANRPSAVKEQRSSSRNGTDARSLSPNSRKEYLQDPTRDFKDRTSVHDTTVDVVIAVSPELRGSRGNTIKPKPSDENVPLKMTVSTWKLENQVYHTLTFSSLAAHHVHSQTRTVNKPVKLDAHGSPSSTASSSSAGSAWCSACGMPSTFSPTAKLSISRYPPHESLGQISQTSPDSTLQKTLKMKDALLGCMELPSFCLWKDSSLAISNEAMLQLMRRPSDPLNHSPQEIIERFEVWDPDFREPVKPENYPIFQLCQSEARSMKWRFGLITHEGKRYTFDAIGKGVFDEMTDEFLAGVVTLKDVTEYTEIIKSQSEKNEEQFQLICDTMPQMVC